MVELVDAPDSKSGGLRPLGVRVPPSALARTAGDSPIQLRAQLGSNLPEVPRMYGMNAFEAC